MKRFVAASLLAMAVAASGSAFAYPYYGGSYPSNSYESGPRYDSAQVTHVAPIFERVPVQRQECWYEPTNGYANANRYGDPYYGDRYSNAYPQYNNGYPRSSQNTTAAVVGAIIGGALGNQVGKGDGRKAATIAGAVIGAAVGNNTGNRAKARYQNGAYNGYGSVQRCRVVTDYQDERVVGYDVTYRYAGHTYHTRTAYHPGSTIRVRVDVRP